MLKIVGFLIAAAGVYLVGQAIGLAIVHALQPLHNILAIG